MHFIPDFHEYIERRHKQYKALKPVFCKPLGEYVYFDSDGFRHLLFKTRHKVRPITEQKYKLDLVPGIRSALTKATVILEQRKSVHNDKEIRYWAVVGKWRNFIHLRVIIKRVGSGKLRFWSVMRQKAGNLKPRP
jgi:hypothetical protein